MIKDYKGAKLTPKQVAKRMLYNSLNGAYYQLEQAPELEKMLTERESKQIFQQLDRLIERVEKALNFKDDDYKCL